MSSLDLRLAVHEPYGTFDPTLKSKLYGNSRMDGAPCAASGGRDGPGRAATRARNVPE
ncbi:MAG: hypothetical protein IT164_12700 [Bryobacterales bacterium]|nr:hypothetical protein [Bryobacterales bacterium]